MILEEMVEVEINDVTVSNNTIFINSILAITLYEISGVITLTSTKIIDHYQYDPPSSTSCGNLDSYYVSYVSKNVLSE